MGRRRERFDNRQEKQHATRKANAPRKAKERARKAAYAAAKQAKQAQNPESDSK